MSDGIDEKEKRERARQLISDAINIIEKRQAEPHIDRFFLAVSQGKLPEPLDRLVATFALRRALNTAPGRKAAGLPARGRGKDPRFDASTYGPGSEPLRIAALYREGDLTRAQARDDLSLVLGGGNNKTLDALLDGLCERIDLFPAGLLTLPK